MSASSYPQMDSSAIHSQPSAAGRPRSRTTERAHGCSTPEIPVSRNSTAFAGSASYGIASFASTINVARGTASRTARSRASSSAIVPESFTLIRSKPLGRLVGGKCRARLCAERADEPAQGEWRPDRERLSSASVSADSSAHSRYPFAASDPRGRHGRSAASRPMIASAVARRRPAPAPPRPFARPGRSSVASPAPRRPSLSSTSTTSERAPRRRGRLSRYSPMGFLYGASRDCFRSPMTVGSLTLAYAAPSEQFIRRANST